MTTLQRKEKMPEINDKAPAFTLLDQDDQEISLDDFAGKWLVLYFYPKAGTPGCTKQACGFRDNVSQIRKQGAEIFGISTDNVEQLKKFKEKHNLNFVLLADPKRIAVKAYQTKMPLLNISKRWTYIIDPQLHIQSIEKGVDPVLDARRVAETIENLRSGIQTPQ